jgi:serine/threonine protein kinase
MLECVQFFHEGGYVHRDIKPENFMVKKNQVYLIDFGVAKKYLKEDGTHIPDSRGKQTVGSLNFTSIASHEGREMSRRDDIEILGYSMLYMSEKEKQRDLPWIKAMEVPYEQQNMK